MNTRGVEPKWKKEKGVVIKMLVKRGKGFTFGGGWVSHAVSSLKPPGAGGMTWKWKQCGNIERDRKHIKEGRGVVYPKGERRWQTWERGGGNFGSVEVLVSPCVSGSAAPASQR